MTRQSFATALLGAVLTLNIFIFRAATTAELWHGAVITDIQLVVSAVALFFLLRDPRTGR